MLDQQIPRIPAKTSSTEECALVKGLRELAESRERAAAMSYFAAVRAQRPSWIARQLKAIKRSLSRRVS